MTTVEGTSSEIEQLEVQHEEALLQLKDAERKLEELNECRIELAPAAFTGDEVADKNLMVLEAEASKISRRVRLARNAAKEFERLIEEAKKRRVEERQRLARERFEELAAERYGLGVEAEEGMSTLLETLERYKSIHAEQVACARGFDDDSPKESTAHAYTSLARKSTKGVPGYKLDRPLRQAASRSGRPRSEALRRGVSGGRNRAPALPVFVTFVMLVKST